MVSVINDAFLKFEKRAEGADLDKLTETFVDVGPLFTLLGLPEHQIVYGRRGTGKVIAHRPFHDVQLRRELSASVMFA